MIVFTLGIVNISRSLSKSDTAEDIIEENDERNRLISLRINNMRYKILIVVIYISVVAGMLAYGVTSKYKHSYRVTAIASSIVYLVSFFFYLKLFITRRSVKARSPFCGAPI